MSYTYMLPLTPSHIQIAIRSIMEIQELNISHNEASWIIGELIADGWLKLATFYHKNLYEDGEKHFSYVCVLGRPEGITSRMAKEAICQPIIKSGRKSKSCTVDTECSVWNCQNSADFEVIFYDYYVNENIVQFDRDFTCPFICEHHMIENEGRARGIRRPRSSIRYPFTKLNGGQAYTKYLPAVHFNP